MSRVALRIPLTFSLSVSWGTKLRQMEAVGIIVLLWDVWPEGQVDVVRKQRFWRPDSTQLRSVGHLVFLWSLVPRALLGQAVSTSYKAKFKVPTTKSRAVSACADGSPASRYSNGNHNYRLTLSLLRVLNFNFHLLPHKKHHTYTVWRTSLSIAYSDERCVTSNSHYLTYTCLFKRLWECTFWTWEWKR